MVDAGILQIVGVADPFKIGFRVMAMIGVNVRIDGGRGIDEIAREITQFPEVSYVVMSTGTFDLFVEVIAQDTEEFTQFLIDRLHAVQGVTHTEAFMLLRMYKLSLGGWRSAEMVKAAGENGDDAPAPRDGRG
jgi:Lrp/AsnC family transcriptional regulator for asnA, asnC and gidA